MEAQVVELLRALRVVEDKRLALFEAVDEGRVRRSVAGEEIAVAGEGVDEPEMQLWLQQADVFVLTADVDEAVGQLFELAGGGEGAVDPDPAPARSADGAPDEQRVAVARQAQFLKLGVEVHPFEERFDRGLVRAGSDQVEACPAAEDEVERVDEQRLARAGLAGDDVEARAKGDLDRFDDGQILDSQRGDHRW